MSLLSTISRYYFYAINQLHRPFLRRGTDDPFHAVYAKFHGMTQQCESPSILEIGSRNVTGLTRRHAYPHCQDYIGLDILEGECVDVVADIHQLSKHFPKNRFDFVYSTSVFEHLLFPWKAVLEINQVLKPGGHIFLSTHPAWPAHELPWDFWRFPVNGFHSLFNQYTGFEIVTMTEGLPCRLYSLVDDAPTRASFMQPINQGVSLIARKTGDYRSDLLKWDIDVSEVVQTMYPNRKPNKAAA